MVNAVARPPLDGVTVIDLSRVLAGPWSTMALADLGAEIWKIERIDGGDESRACRPPTFNDESTFFLAANRNKKSIALDIATPEGQEIVRALTERADVLVENFRTGALERYGLDAQTLCARYPRLVYCWISGYCRTGARAAEAGYDLVIQAESDLMSITGELGGESQKFDVAISDLVAGMHATQAILAALYARDRTGRGDIIDIALLDTSIALFDTSIALLANVATASLNGDVDAVRATATLTPASNDGGIDIRVWPTGRIEKSPPTILVQCKRERRKIQKMIVKALYSDVLEENAASGLIVTTSTFFYGDG